MRLNSYHWKVLDRIWKLVNRRVGRNRYFGTEESRPSRWRSRPRSLVPSVRFELTLDGF